MKKLKLNLEDIKVESFETNPSKLNQGTVLGHLPESAFCNTDETCLGCNTGGGSLGAAVCPTDYSQCLTCLFESCGGTCYHSCGPGTCYGENTCEVCPSVPINACQINTTPCTEAADTSICWASQNICGPPTCGFTTFP